MFSGVTPINQRQHSVNHAAQTFYLYAGFIITKELGLMDVYLMDRCSLLLWRRPVKSKPAAPAGFCLFPPPSLSLPLVWFSGESRAANAH